MSTVNANLTYNYKVVRQFAIMTVVWGIVGMALGVLIAAQLVWPSLNLDLPFTHFGRLRPLHTNAVIFGFGGSALFATSYYVVQRTCQARLISYGLASFTFWGWQAIIVAAAMAAVPMAIAAVALVVTAFFKAMQGGLLLAHRPLRQRTRSLRRL